MARVRMKLKGHPYEVEKIINELEERFPEYSNEKVARRRIYVGGEIEETFELRNEKVISF